MEKILTVVIPTYNMEAYLAKCLDSLIVPEKMEILDVVIVNDGSKDTSLQIARDYEQRYPDTFRAIDKPNGNYGSCINRGLAEARGRYFKVLDADDSFCTEHFADFLDFLQNSTADLVMSAFAIHHEDKGSVEPITYNLPVGVQFSFDEFARRNVPYMWMHGVTHLTDKLRRIHYQQQEGISYTDKEFVFLPVAVSQWVAYFPQVVYQYVMGREGQTVDRAVWKRNYWMEVKAVRKLVELYEQHKGQLSEAGLLFLRLQLKLYLRSIYHAYLKRFRGEMPIQELVDFDTWLHDLSPEGYDLVSGERESPSFPYVRVWRRCKTNMKQYLTLRFLRRIEFYITFRFLRRK